MSARRFDLCVIGAGSAGLSVAAGAAQMGASVALVERGRMGGDCLNFGCVPSKSLLAAARAAETVRDSARFGVRAGKPGIDGAAVHDHVQRVIAGIAPHDSAERFERLGVRVIRATARFASPEEIEADGERLHARRFVVATGSSPLVPPIPGLASVPFLTNETIFDLREVPRHLIIVGGGPSGVELAQAFRELGAAVTLIEQASVLSCEDPELVAVVRTRLQSQGVMLCEGAGVADVGAETDGLTARLAGAGASSPVRGSHLLIAVGRRPSLEELDLQQAGVDHSEKGIFVDARLRTSNRRIFAIGDCVAGAPRFTHVAGYHAGIVLRNALFRLPAKADHAGVPRVTYTHPELAQVGATEAEARARYAAVTVLRSSFAENDRARTERTTDGLVKVIVDRRGRILGAGIAGACAGELIQTWVLAKSRGMRIGAVATMIAPYPTLGEANKRAAGAFYAPRLFGTWSRRIVRLLARLG